MSESYPLSYNIIDPLLIIKKLFAIPSLMLLVFILILFLFAKNIRNKITQQFILYQIIIEIFLLISLLLPYFYHDPDDNLCFIQSLLINFFIQCKLITALLISYFSIYDTFNKLLLDNHPKLISFIVFIISFIIPFLGCIPFYTDHLSGNFGTYCYLPLNNQETRFFLVTKQLYLAAYKLGMVLIIFYCLYKNEKYKSLFVKLKKNIHKQQITYYPRIVAYFSLVDIISSIYKIVNINESSFWIEFLHIILNCSGGICIFIIFIKSSLFKTLFSRIHKKLKKNELKRKKSSFHKKTSFILDNEPILPSDNPNS